MNEKEIAILLSRIHANGMRVDEINREYGQFEEDIILLNNDVTTINVKVSATETKVEEIERTTTKNVTDIETLNVKIVDVSADLEETDQTVFSISADVANLKNSVTESSTKIADLETNAGGVDAAIRTLDIDVERIDIDVADTNTRVTDLETKEDERAHYLGAFANTAQLIAYPTPTSNDFADNYATGTRWIYTVGAWSDTTNKIPTDSTLLGNVAPLMDGNTSSGVATLASRTDHIHPSDTTRVPTSRSVNGNMLTADVILTASSIAAVPTARTINGKALSSNVVLTNADMGASPTLWLHHVNVNNTAADLRFFFDIINATDSSFTIVSLYQYFLKVAGISIAGYANGTDGNTRPLIYVTVGSPNFLKFSGFTITDNKLTHFMISTSLEGYSVFDSKTELGG